MRKKLYGCSARGFRSPRWGSLTHAYIPSPLRGLLFIVFLCHFDEAAEVLLADFDAEEHIFHAFELN